MFGGAGSQCAEHVLNPVLSGRCAGLRPQPLVSSRRPGCRGLPSRCRRRVSSACSSSSSSSAVNVRDEAQGSPACEEGSGSPRHTQRHAALLAAACGLWLVARRPQAGSAFLSVATATAPASFLGVAQSAWAGMGAGFLHTLSGPDHLAALIPLAVGRTMVKASLLGALWGFGHSLGQLVLGLLLLLLKDRFKQLLPALSRYASLTVGLTLLLIGGLGLVETRHQAQEAAAEGALASDLRLAPAGVGDASPAGFQATDVTAGAVVPADGASAPALAPGAAQGGDVTALRTLATGVVFGLQPDALYVILPALVLPTKLAAASYIALFVVGTVTAMGSYSAFIGATSHALAQRDASIITSLSTVASGVALAVGCAIVAVACGVPVPFFQG